MPAQGNRLLLNRDLQLWFMNTINEGLLNYAGCLQSFDTGGELSIEVTRMLECRFPALDAAYCIQLMLIAVYTIIVAIYPSA